MGKPTFFFYDLETSGFNPREARVMQFAGQRADLNLKPIGQPHNHLIRLSEDVLPDPDAVLVTGLTPQLVQAEGITEAEFLKLFHEEVVLPDTIFVGFNSVRFDDEFMRYLHYRNFYDPYEWQWKDGRSRWDLLDVVRMMRALRPEGIKWPFDSAGKPSNQLTLLTSINKLDHDNAHDALNDVMATLALARLVREKQAKLFEFLLKMRDKKQIEKLVKKNEPFIYTSGKYDSEWEKTTAVSVLAEHPNKRGVLVYDLRYNPDPFTQLKPAELAETWRRRWDEPGLRLPIKTLQFNRCPAVAPLSVLDADSQKRLGLRPEAITKQLAKINKANLAPAILEALELLDQKQQAKLLEDESEVDSRLYEGFFSDLDKTKMSVVRAAEGEELRDLEVIFKDQRLQVLLPLYKARNYPKTLTDEDRSVWNSFVERKLLTGGEKSRLGRYFNRINELKQNRTLSGEQKYLLEELELYGQSVMPSGG